MGAPRRACAAARASVIAWTGTFALPATASPVAIDVRVQGGARAIVSLGPGHAAAQRIAVTLHGKRIRFVLPGLPQNVVFDGTVRGRPPRRRRASGRAARHVLAAPRGVEDRRAARCVPKRRGCGRRGHRGGRPAADADRVPVRRGARHRLVVHGRRAARRHERQRRDRHRRDAASPGTERTTRGSRSASARCASASTQRRSRCRPASGRSRRS